MWRDRIARPKVNMGIVATKAIKVAIIVLDFMVMAVEWIMPSFVPFSGPRLNNASPSEVNGRKNQRSRIRPFTRRRRSITLLNGSLASRRNEKAIIMAGTRATKRSDVATTMENAPATTVLTLGSRRWITESPCTKLSSIT
jgi:hypothetical protein